MASSRIPAEHDIRIRQRAGFARPHLLAVRVRARADQDGGQPGVAHHLGDQPFDHRNICDHAKFGDCQAERGKKNDKREGRTNDCRAFL